MLNKLALSKRRTMAALVVPIPVFFVVVMLPWQEGEAIRGLLVALGLALFATEIFVVWPLTRDWHAHPALGWVVVGMLWVFFGLLLGVEYIDGMDWNWFLLLLIFLDTVILYISGSLFIIHLAVQLDVRQLLSWLRDNLDKRRLLSWLQDDLDKQPGRYFWIAVVLAAFISSDLALPVAILIAVFHWLKTDGKSTARLHQGVVLGVAAIVAVVSYLNLFSLLSLQVLNWILIIALGNCRYQLPRLSVSLKVVLVGIASGALMFGLLFTPTFAWIWRLFVPGAEQPSLADDPSTWIRIALGAIVALLTGPIAVIWGQPGGRSGRFLAGMVSLALAGGILFGLLGGPVAGIAAYAPLYDVSLSRSGYGGSNWVLRLALALSGVFPAVLGTSWLLVGGSALVGGVTGLFAPGWSRSTRHPSPPTLNALLSDLMGGSIGNLQLVVLTLVTFAVAMNLLAPAIQNLLDVFGATPPWPLWWSTVVPFAQFWLILILWQVVALICLYQQGRPFTSRMFAARAYTTYSTSIYLIAAAGLVPAVVGMMSFSGPIHLIVSLITITLSVEILSVAPKALQAVFLGDDNKSPSSALTPLPWEPEGWTGADLVAGLLTGILSYQFVVVILSILFVAIPMLPGLANTTAPPPGVDWLWEVLSDSFFASLAQFLAVVIVFIFASLSPFSPIYTPFRKIVNLVTDTDYVLHRSERGPRSTGTRGHVTLLGKQLSRSVGKLLLVAAIGSALLSIHAFLIAGLAAAATFLLTRDLHLERLIWPMLILVSGLTLIGLVGLTAGETYQFPLDALWARLAYSFVFGPAVAITYRSLLAYAPGRSRLIVRLAVLLGGGLLIMLPTYASRDVVSVDGSVSHFDGQHWEVLASENSAIGGTLNYQFFLDSQEHLWYGGGSGVIVERIGDEWRSYLIRFITEMSDQPREELLGAHLQFTEDLQGRLWVAHGTTFGQFDPAMEATSFYLRVPSRLLTRDQADALEEVLTGAAKPLSPTETEVTEAKGIGEKILSKVQEPISVTVTIHLPSTGMVIDAVGDLWLATAGDGAMRLEGNRELDDARWQFFTAENSGIASDDVRSVYADRAGNIWFGTTGGLSRFDGTVWETIAAPGMDGSEPVVAFLEDSNGWLWIGTTGGGYRWDGQTWTLFEEMDGWSDRFGVEVLFEDSQGGLWAGTENGALRFNGLQWVNLVPGMHVTTFDSEPSGSIVWIGTRENLLRYDVQTGEQVSFDSENSGMAVQWVRDLHVDSDGGLWVSTFAATRTPRSLWWGYGLVILSFGYLFINTYRGYRRASETQARKLGQDIMAKPDSLYPTIYNLLASEQDTPSSILTWLTNVPAASDVLVRLANYLTHAGDTAGAKAIVALVALYSESQIDEALDQSISALQVDSARAWAGSLYQLHSLLAVALAAHRASEIANLELAVRFGWKTGGLSLWSSGELVEALPPFLPHGSSEAWLTLEQVSLALYKYRDVDTSVDRLSYLAGALGAIENAHIATRSVGPPEGIVMAIVVNRWRTAIANEINTVGGQAKLQLELRTQQIRRAARTTLALRLQNSGQTVAENVVVVLQPGEGFSSAGETQVTLERLSSGGSIPVEFAIAPADVEAIRVACRVTWNDRVTEGNEIEFAGIVRFYEVTEEFHHIPNPYIAGHPIKSAKMFHGREDVFRFIAANLSGLVQDRTLVLHGQRRTGKTSILYQLLHGRLGENFIPVLIDMQELAPLVNDTGDLLGELAYQLARAARKAGVVVGEPMPEAFVTAPTRSFNRFLDVLEDGLGDHRVVIMFDEFELLESKIAAGKLDADILGYFRSLIQHRDCLVFIFTGTHRLDKMSHDYWSILFNIALYRRISFLNSEDAARLIREPISGSLDVDELAVEKIISLTSGHPYFIQLICWALVNHCNERKRNYATINDMNEAMHEILMTGEAHFAFIWQQATGTERLALAGLAHTLRPGKAWARPDEILGTLIASGDTQSQRMALVNTLDQLVAQEVLKVAGDGALRYCFQLGVLQLWVETTKPIAALLERVQ